MAQSHLRESGSRGAAALLDFEARALSRHAVPALRLLLLLSLARSTDLGTGVALCGCLSSE